MWEETRIQVQLGNGEEALKVAEGALELLRDNGPSTGALIWSLHAVAIAALSCFNYERTVEVAREGRDILISPAGLEYWQNMELCSPLCPCLFALLSYAEANLGRWSTALVYAHRAVDASLDIGNMKLYVSVTTATQSYMETRGNLANIFMATGNIVLARQVYEEQRVYFSQRVGKRIGDYRDLVPALRILGVLYCSKGQHDQELSRIVRMLGNAYPNVQKQVKIRLHQQTKVPIFSSKPSRPINRLSVAWCGGSDGLIPGPNKYK